MEIQTSKQQETLFKAILLVGVRGTNFELLILNCVLFSYNVHKMFAMVQIMMVHGE